MATTTTTFRKYKPNNNEQYKTKAYKPTKQTNKKTKRNDIKTNWRWRNVIAIGTKNLCFFALGYMCGRYVRMQYGNVTIIVPMKLPLDPEKQ